MPDWMAANYVKINQDVRFDDLQKKIDDQRKELYHWENTDPTVHVEPLKNIVFSETAKILSFTNQKMR